MPKRTTKKATKKAATKKVAAKKAPAKKAPAKKAPVTGTAVKKTRVAAAKKAAPRKTAAKKTVSQAADAITSSTSTPAKTTAPTRETPKRVQETKIIARVDVGFGNDLYIRGEGAGLNWDKGMLMENVTPYEWVFTTTQAKTGVVFKFLINDEVWAEGENLSVSAGGTSISSPAFPW